jgi:hypothetical protein
MYRNTIIVFSNLFIILYMYRNFASVIFSPIVITYFLVCRINELSSVNTLRELKLRRTSRMSKQSYVSVYRV